MAVTFGLAERHHSGLSQLPGSFKRYWECCVCHLWFRKPLDLCPWPIMVGQLRLGLTSLPSYFPVVPESLSINARPQRAKTEPSTKASNLDTEWGASQKPPLRAQPSDSVVSMNSFSQMRSKCKEHDHGQPCTRDKARNAGTSRHRDDGGEAFFG